MSDAIRFVPRIRVPRVARARAFDDSSDARGEDGARATEARNTAVYLDAMKLIMSIYRQLEHGRGRAS